MSNTFSGEFLWNFVYPESVYPKLFWSHQNHGFFVSSWKSLWNFVYLEFAYPKRFWSYQNKAFFSYVLEKACEILFVYSLCILKCSGPIEIRVFSRKLLKSLWKFVYSEFVYPTLFLSHQNHGFFCKFLKKPEKFFVYPELSLSCHNRLDKVSVYIVLKQILTWNWKKQRCHSFWS